MNIIELKITQRPENGFLGGPKHVDFTVCHGDASHKITIDQLCERKIVITSLEGCPYKDTLDIYYTLETLLMLFDGQFYPVVSAFENDVEITQSWNKRALPSYHSADFMIGTENKLFDFELVLDDQLFEKWYTLKEELDLIHKMVLYCLSGVEMPKDMQCAFMVEAFSGVCELIHKKKPGFSLPSVPKWDSELRHYFLAVVNKYGSNIFDVELTINKEKFAQVLVNSRNRIAHIKCKQGRTYLDGGESVMYLVKLSLLYRVVLFELLGISDNLYNDKLVARIQVINKHDIMQEFLKKLAAL